jgi:hypothetical protein
MIWCVCAGGADIERAELPALQGGEVQAHQREHQPAGTLVRSPYLLPTVVVKYLTNHPGK